MAETRTLKLNLLADIDNFTRGMNTADNATNDFTNKIVDFSKKAAVAFGAVVTAAAYMAVRVASEGMQMAADLAETMSKTGEVFKENTDDIVAWSKSAGRSFGLTQQSALDSASTFALYAKSAGLGAKETVAFSKKLVGLSADLASFYNTGVEDAAYALGAALRGESEPLRRYNILLDAGTIKAAAMRSEFEATGKETSATGKILGAYTSILEQSTVAQGDFARTSDGLANQQRILTAEIGVTKVAFGEMFLPIAKDVTMWVNNNMLPAIQDVIAGFKGERGMVPAIRDATKLLDGVKEGDFESPFYNIGEGLKSIAISFGKIGEALTSTKMEDGKSNLEAIASSLESIAKFIDDVGGFIGFVREAGSKPFNFGLWKLFSDKLLGPENDKGGGRAAGGSVMGNKAYRVGEFGPETFIPNGVSGRIVPNASSGNVTINLNGIVDAESARRSIERILQDSGRRTAAVNLIGSAL